jgi:SAM-dependent methyltransferase
LGVSDRHYFAWLTAALARFERETEALASLGAPPSGVELWVLAGARSNPAIEFARDALGRARATVTFLDRFERAPSVRPADFNALGDLPGECCDVLMMTRASYMIEDPAEFIRQAHRLIRPDGLLVIDWLHGAAELPVLDLPGRHCYEGRGYPFRTTYCDAESVNEFGGEFAALLHHAARPTLGERVKRMLGGEAARAVPGSAYLDTLRAALGRAGKNLVDPDTLDPFFKVIFRDARYLHPLTKKFYLHLLTILRPVGK